LLLFDKIVEELEGRFREPLSVWQQESLEVAYVASRLGDSYHDMVAAFIDRDALISKDWVVHSAQEEHGHLNILESLSAGPFSVIVRKALERSQLDYNPFTVL